MYECSWGTFIQTVVNNIYYYNLGKEGNIYEAFDCAVPQNWQSLCIWIIIRGRDHCQTHTCERCEVRFNITHSSYIQSNSLYSLQKYAWLADNFNTPVNKSIFSNCLLESTKNHLHSFWCLKYVYPDCYTEWPDILDFLGKSVIYV